MKTKKIMSATLVLFSLVPAAIICLFFLITMGIKQSEQNDVIISAHAQIRTNAVKSFFKESFHMLDTISEVIDAEKMLKEYKTQETSLQEPSSEQAIYSFKKYTLAREAVANIIKSHPAVKRVSIIDENNAIVLSSNSGIENRKSMLEEKYIEILKLNKPVVSRVFVDTYESNAECFIAAVPVFNGDEFLGFIMTSFDLLYMNEGMQGNTFFETGTVLVLDDSHNPVIYSDRSITPITMRTVSDKIMRIGKQTGEFKIKQGRNDYNVSFVVMEKTGWTVACFANMADFGMALHLIVFYILSIIGIFVFVIMMLEFLLTKWFTTPLERLISCLHKMEKGDYDTRVPYLGKNEFSEIGAAFNKLMTRIALDNKELVIKEERYRIANEQSNSIIFEYNVEQSSVTCSANAREFAEYPEFLRNFPDSLDRLKVVHEDDVDEFITLFDSMSQGKRQGNMELRMRIYKGEFHWFTLSLTTIADIKTFKPLRIIGKLTDIDEEKRLTENLTFKAERDPLTGIYNKLATQTIISQRISERKHDLYYAFIVMDIDCFKNVNDTYGHQKGDAVLVDLAKALIVKIRGNDVAGRIGGDEFMLMLTEMPSKELVAKKLEAVLEIIRKIPLDEANGKFVTVSIGVALCPQDGTTFSQLYASADNALYACKKAGKNGFCFSENAILTEDIKDITNE